MKRIDPPLQKRAQECGQAPALITENRTVSYFEYRQLANIAAANLVRNGIRPGDRVGILSKNSVDFILLLMGAFQAGAVACPVSPRFPERTVDALLAKAGCACLIVDPHAPRRGPFSCPTLPLPSFSSTPEGPGGAAEPGEVDLAQDATIIFTSGSSAEPKAVLHTYGNHYYSALGSNRNIALGAGDRWLLSLPLYHVGGMAILFRCLLSGAAVVVPEENHEPTEAIGRFRATHVSLVATQLKRLLDAAGSTGRPGVVRHVLLGGSAIPRKLIVRAMQMGLNLYTSYGSTEMASQTTTTAAGDSAEKLFTSGRVLPYREVKISEENEILVRGKTRFKGYVRKSALELPFDQDGWFATSDLGEIGAEGYLRVRGRRDNMFISGGENIQPEEIEAELGRMDGVGEVLVVSAADDDFGRRPVAFVRLKNGREPDAAQMVSFLERTLPRFKIPVRFYGWPESSDSGRLKPDRRRFERLAQTLGTAESD